MLSVEDLAVSYDGVPALQGVSLRIDRGEIVALVGSNGAGKTTLARAISGVLSPDAGEIRFEDRRISGLPAHDVVRLGISHVPEGRHIFPKLSVVENLQLGAYTSRSKQEVQERLDFVYGLFPVLAERKAQKAGSLSGGQQQMLALGRGLMAGPRFLILDEPSLGLMPKLVEAVFATVRRIREEGITILLVEQRVLEALELCDRGYVLQSGQVAMEASGEELIASDMVRQAYLGM